MGVIKRGILGGFSGKVANVIGGSWKGIAYMRAMPLSVANPKTAGQVAQRTKFSAVVAFSKAILTGLIKPCWDRFAQQMSGYNAFVSTNVDAFDSVGDLIPASLIIAEGSLTPADAVVVTGTDASVTTTLTWVDNSGTGTALATDEVFGGIYNATTKEFELVETGKTRADLTADATMSVVSNTGEQILGYLAFRRVDGTLVSNQVMDNFVIL